MCAFLSSYVFFLFKSVLNADGVPFYFIVSLVFCGFQCGCGQVIMGAACLVYISFEDMCEMILGHRRVFSR